MRVLFVDGQHVPKPDANGNCVQKLRKKLYELGLESDVLTILCGEEKRDETDEYGKIYSAHLYGKKVFFLKVINHLTGGFFVWEKTYSDVMCIPLKLRLAELCRTKKYEWVISVSMPFCIHRVTTRTNLNGARLAIYNLDPYAFNEALPASRREKRLKEELEVYEHADVIFTSLEHRNDWEKSQFVKYMNKVRFIPYPNLEPYDGYMEEPPFPKREGWIEMVYAGALHDRVRQPKEMLQLLKEIAARGAKCYLIIVGNRSGSIVAKQLETAKEELGDYLMVYDSIPFPQAMGLIYRADLLINIENRMKNQIPSKILDYIATGKTIINIGTKRPNIAEIYLSKYPKAIDLDEEDLKNSAGKVKNVLAMLEADEVKDLKWDEISVLMSEFVSSSVAKSFLSALVNQ